MTGGEWTAQLDLVTDMEPFYTGTEAGAKKAAMLHRDSDNAFVEDSDGNAFAYNRHTREWDSL